MRIYIFSGMLESTRCYPCLLQGQRRVGFDHSLHHGIDCFPVMTHFPYFFVQPSCFLTFLRTTSCILIFESSDTLCTNKSCVMSPSSPYSSHIESMEHTRTHYRSPICSAFPWVLLHSAPLSSCIRLISSGCPCIRWSRSTPCGVLLHFLLVVVLRATPLLP